VLADFHQAPIPGAERVLFAFVARLNRAPARITGADVAAVLAAGWSQSAVYDAITVCALFNFYNRWIDGSGVHGLTPEGYVRSAQRLVQFGYGSGPSGQP
jgi:alkylhydroperoxidase family enzyme